MPGREMTKGFRQRGYALLMALLALALLGLASGVAVHSASLDAQREHEDELLFVGAQYRDALRRYQAASDGAENPFPQRLEELLDDRRGPTPRRHLRRLYRDPTTGRLDWTLATHQGRIVGIASSSARPPLKRVGFDAADAAFARARTYADWVFSATDGAAATDPKAPPP